MATIQGRFPSTNPKYPFVGPNYQQYGEQPGLDYNPYTDMYRPNKEAAQGMGLLPPEPKQPGLAEQMIPIAAALGTQEAVKGASGLIGGLLNAKPAVDATALLTGGESIGLGGTGIAGTKFSLGGLLGGTPVSGGSIATPGAASPSLIGSAIPSGLGSIGIAPLAAIGLGLLAGGKGVKDLLRGKDGTSSLEGLAGRTTLGIATGGLSELARATGLLGRKSTKDYQRERWGALGDRAQQYRKDSAIENDDGIWDTGKYQGEKWTFDKALDLAKEDPTHFIGVLGNFETFGDKWLDLPVEKQKEVVAALAAQNLYHSDKGDILISDSNQAKAMEIFNSIINPEENKIDTTKP